MRYSRGGEWTEETQAEFERLYEVYNDGSRETIFALLAEEKFLLEEQVELDKRGIQSLENKIDMQQAEIEDLLRLLREWFWMSKHVGWGVGGALLQRSGAELRRQGEYVDLGERREDGSLRPASVPRRGEHIFVRDQRFEVAQVQHKLPGHQIIVIATVISSREERVSE